MIRASALCLALALPLLAAPACAQEAPPPGAPALDEAVMRLSATGEVRAAPDMAVVSAGVVTEAETAAAALSANAERMRGVFAALDEAGVAEADRQTSNLSVQPIYAYASEDGRRERTLTGYEARNTVTAIVRDLDAVGAAVDALIGGGANELQNLSFGLEDRQEAEDAARRQAMAELARVRDLYAELGGFETGRLVSLSESSGGGARPMAMAAEMVRVSAAPTPVAAGELTISVTVNAAYAIEE